MAISRDKLNRHLTAIIESPQAELILLEGSNINGNGQLIYDQISQTQPKILHLASPRDTFITPKQFCELIQQHFQIKTSWLDRRSWQSALKCLKKVTLTSTEKLIIIINNFSQLNWKENDILKFTHYWDKHWSKQTNVKLFFCGSANDPSYISHLKCFFITSATKNITTYKAGLTESDETTMQRILQESLLDTNPKKHMLQEVANTYGYECHEIERDGNCFFNAAIHQLTLLNTNQYNHLTAMQLRQQLVDHIIKHKQFYASYIEEFQQYVEQQQQDHVWAGDLTPLVFSREFNINVAIIRSDNTAPILHKQANACGTIFLGYEAGSHYQSLLRDPNKPSSQTVDFAHEEIDNFTAIIRQSSAPEAVDAVAFDRSVNHLPPKMYQHRFFNLITSLEEEKSAEQKLESHQGGLVQQGR